MNPNEKIEKTESNEPTELKDRMLKWLSDEEKKDCAFTLQQNTLVLSTQKAFSPNVSSGLNYVYNSMQSDISLKNVAKEGFNITAELNNPIDGITKLTVCLTKDM